MLLFIHLAQHKITSIQSTDRYWEQIRILFLESLTHADRRQLLTKISRVKKKKKDPITGDSEVSCCSISKTDH